MSFSLGRHQLLLCCFPLKKTKLLLLKLEKNRKENPNCWSPRRRAWRETCLVSPTSLLHVFFCFYSLIEWLLSGNVAQNLGQICSCQTKTITAGVSPGVHQLPNQESSSFNVESFGPKINSLRLPSPSSCAPVTSETQCVWVFLFSLHCGYESKILTNRVRTSGKLGHFGQSSLSFQRLISRRWVKLS